MSGVRDARRGLGTTGSYFSAGSATSLTPNELMTFRTVSNSGFDDPLNDLYKLSRERPVSFAIFVIPFARAIVSSAAQI
jgi:hypothetical protein